MDHFLNFAVIVICFSITSKFLISSIQAENNQMLFSKRYHSLDSWHYLHDRLSTFEQVTLGYRLAWPLRVLVVAVVVQLSWTYHLVRLIVLGVTLAVVFTYRDPKAEWIVAQPSLPPRKPPSRHVIAVRKKTPSAVVAPPKIVPTTNGPVQTKPPPFAPPPAKPLPPQGQPVNAEQSVIHSDDTHIRHALDATVEESPEIAPVPRRLSYSKALGAENQRAISKKNRTGGKRSAPENLMGSVSKGPKIETRVIEEPVNPKIRAIEKIHDSTHPIERSQNKKRPHHSNHSPADDIKRRRNEAVGQSASAFQKPDTKRSSKRKSNAEDERYSKSTRIQKDMARAQIPSRGSNRSGMGGGAFQVYNLQVRKRPAAGTLVIAKPEQAIKRGRPSLLQQAIGSQKPQMKPAEELLEDSIENSQLSLRPSPLTTLTKLKQSKLPVTHGRIPLKQKRYPWDSAQEHPSASKHHQEELAREEKAAQLSVMTMLARAHDVATGAVAPNKSTDGKETAISGQSKDLKSGGAENTQQGFKFSLEQAKGDEKAKPQGFQFTSQEAKATDTKVDGTEERSKASAPPFKFGDSKTPDSTKQLSFNFGGSAEKLKKDDSKKEAAFAFGTGTPPISTSSSNPTGDSPKPNSVFSFGSAPITAAPIAPTGGGEEKKEKNMEAPAPTGFSFGAKPSGEKNSSTGSLTVIPEKSDSFSKPSGFMLGQPNDTKPSTPAQENQTKEETSKPIGFPFGAAAGTETSEPKDKGTSGLTFGSAATTALKPSEPSGGNKTSNPGFSFGAAKTSSDPSKPAADAAKTPFSFGAPAAIAKDSSDSASASTSKITFGTAKPSEPNKSTTPASTLGFGFGAAKPSEPQKSSSDPPKASFTFGCTSPTPTPSSTDPQAAPAFGFGSATANTSNSSGFGNNANKPGETKPAFGFGTSKQSVSPAVNPQETKETKSSFGFGTTSKSTPSSPGGFGFGAAKPQTPSKVPGSAFAFGKASSNAADPQPSTMTFGSPTPASKPPTVPSNPASNTPTFGQSTPFKSQATANSSGPAFSFGSGSSAPAFGQSASNTPAFGQSAGGGTFAFGQTKTGTGSQGFGSSPNISFGNVAQSSPSPFGGGTASASTGGFGGSTAQVGTASPFGAGSAATPSAPAATSPAPFGFGSAGTLTASQQPPSPFGVPNASPIPAAPGGGASGFALGAQSTKGRRKVRVKSRAKR